MCLHCVTKKTLKISAFLILDVGVLVMDTELSHKEMLEK